MHDALATWSQQGLWPRINEALRTKTRLMLKNAMPSAAVIDSQSVKGGQLPALSCGYDAGKKLMGRKGQAAVVPVLSQPDELIDDLR